MYSLIKYYDRYDIIIEVFSDNVINALELFKSNHEYAFMNNDIMILEIKLIDETTYFLYKK